GGVSGTSCPKSTTETTIAGSTDDVTTRITKRGKPKVDVPKSPATQLVVCDLIVGQGTEVKPGAKVTVHYVGVDQASGQQFDASWDRGQPISFPLGQVIKGWTDGIPGMKVGGRRELIIPGDQAYANQPPQGSGIQPNETLVFVIDLIAVAQ